MRNHTDIIAPESLPRVSVTTIDVWLFDGCLCMGAFIIQEGEDYRIMGEFLPGVFPEGGAAILDFPIIHYRTSLGYGQREKSTMFDLPVTDSQALIISIFGEAVGNTSLHDFAESANDQE